MRHVWLFLVLTVMCLVGTTAQAVVVAEYDYSKTAKNPTAQGWTLYSTAAGDTWTNGYDASIWAGQSGWRVIDGSTQRIWNYQMVPTTEQAALMSSGWTAEWTFTLDKDWWGANGTSYVATAIQGNNGLFVRVPGYTYYVTLSADTAGDLRFYDQVAYHSLTGVSAFDTQYTVTVTYDGTDAVLSYGSTDIALNKSSTVGGDPWVVFGSHNQSGRSSVVYDFFSLDAPIRIMDPSPANGEMGVDPSGLALNWSAPVVGGPYKYDVYVSTSADPNTLALVSENQEALGYTVSPELGLAQLRYWRVDVKDYTTGSLVTEGNLLSFTTGGGVWNRFPTDGSKAGYDTVRLSWDSTLASSYDVYFGTTSDLSGITAVNTTEKNLLVDIDPNTPYYWAVDTKDGGGSVMVTGDVYQFTTGVPVAHWKLDDASGSIAADAVNSYDGTVMIDPNHWTAGAIRGGLELSGGANNTYSPYVDLNSHAAAFSALSEGTITAWVKPDYNTNFVGSIFDISDSTEGSVELGFWIDLRDGDLGLATRGGSAPANLIVDGANLIDGNWHHVAVTVDSVQQVIFYIDGAAQELTGTSNFLDIPNANHVSIGRNLDSTVGGGQWFYDGVVDDVRLFSAPLTADEVLALYDLGAPAKNPAPVDGETRVAIDAVCTWTPGFEGDSQVLVFDDDPILAVDGDLLEGPIALSNTASSHDPLGATDLEQETTYYWRVDTIQGSYTIEGPVWSFTTIPPIASDPDPADGETDVAQNKILSWAAGANFNAGSGDHHEVYIAVGTDASDLPVVPTDTVIGEGYDPSGANELAFATSYVWRIDEFIGGTLYPGDIWAFTTGARVCDPVLLSDVNGDCTVDLTDFAQLALEWLDCTLVNGDCP